LNVAPGTYSLVAAKNGFVFRFDTAPVVTVTAGESEVSNLALEAASRTISGVVGGPAGTFVVPGMQIFADSEVGAFAIGVAGENGQFSVPVVAGEWMIEVTERQLVSLGYISAEEGLPVSTMAGNAENVRVELTPVNALIHGTLKTAQGTPLSGIYIRGSNGSKESYGGTDAEGRFVMGVTQGQWGISADSDQLQALNYFVNGSTVQVVADQSVLVTLTATELTAGISGRLVDETGAAISGMTLVIQPVPFQGGGNNSIYPVTGADGSFEVSLFGGTWNVALECEDAQARGFVSPSIDVTVPQTGSLSNVLVRVTRATSQITGTVRDAAANPIANLQIDAGASIDGTFYNAGCVTTDAQGTFSISVVPGNWTVNLRTDELEARGYAAVAGQNVVVGAGANVVNFVVPTAGPIQLNNPRRLGDGRLEFQVSGSAGTTYIVEGSTTLLPGSWNAVTTVVAAGATITITATEPVQTARFYRIRKQ
ncbi:MAG: carboxypeptidase regulatory-like domain-containing protein, partial [Limisphaerales bacterium]